MGRNIFLCLLFVCLQSGREDGLEVCGRGGSRRNLGHDDTCRRTRVGCPSSSSRDKIDKRHWHECSSSWICLVSCFHRRPAVPFQWPKLERLNADRWSLFFSTNHHFL